jgi:hypothetical protein
MNYEDFVKTVITNLGSQITPALKNYASDIEKDANDFFQDTKKDMEKWTKDLASGKLTKDDFDTLVKGKSDLTKMRYLKKKGIAKIEIEKVKTSLIDTVISTGFSLIP